MLRYDEKRSEYFKCVINSIFTSFLNVKPTEEERAISKELQQVPANPKIRTGERKMLLNFMNKLKIPVIILVLLASKNGMKRRLRQVIYNLFNKSLRRELREG